MATKPVDNGPRSNDCGCLVGPDRLLSTPCVRWSSAHPFTCGTAPRANHIETPILFPQTLKACCFGVCSVKHQACTTGVIQKGTAMHCNHSPG